jgi:hypothetical protein
MEKRSIIFGTYDTAEHGWTLTALKLADAEEKTNYIDKPGGDGSWDLSTALTDGIPRYKDRTLTATFECSESDRLGREDIIHEMVNTLDGMRVRIELPDDLFYYLMGKVHVARNYNDPAHASVTVTAICEPWRHSIIESVYTLTASSTAQDIVLSNTGRRAVVPTVTVEDSVLLVYGETSQALYAGTYKLPDLLLTPGDHLLTYSGNGALTVTFREGVL